MSHLQSRMDLLHTKLHLPPLREKRVERMHLLDRLDAAARRRLTLICAPAGYGKTTLLSQWIHRRSEPVCWVSIDSSDNDLAQFLRYFLAALQRVDPDVGALVPGMLQPPKPLPGQSVWISLINDIAASSKEFIVILDDYHLVESRDVHAALDYLVEHMPGNMHLILATRADPPLNLPQLRARGHLLEIRAADLCFTSSDARLFFQEVMDLALPEREIEALVQKCEGWIAGLQIAGILFQDQPNISQQVDAFTGSHRHILDYLAKEVIEKLPVTTQDFLHQTSILSELEASLCDAVTGRSDSQEILEQLDRQNQFIVPLDDDRRWYRYHRLMAEALQRRTERFETGRLHAIHQRASIWYTEQGIVDKSIDHALKAGDAERAAALIENGAETMLKRSQVSTLLHWLELLPDDLIRVRPRLNLAYAWALLFNGSPGQAVQARLDASHAGAEDVSLSAEEDVIRALIATLAGSVEHGFTCSRRALENLPADRSFLRSIAAGNLGMDYVILGDIESAIEAFKESIALAQDSGNIMFAVASLSNLGGLYILQGRLHLAAAVYRQALELATTAHGLRLPVASRPLMGLGEITREWNDLDEARALFEEALELSQKYNETAELVMYLSLARVLQEQGEGDRALDLLQKAQALAMQSTSTAIDDRLVEIALVRSWLQQDNLAGAIEWAARRGFEGDVSSRAREASSPSIPYDLLEAEHMLYARIQLARKNAQAALETLTALLTEAEQRGRIRRLNEILALISIAQHEMGSIDLAMGTLKRTLQQAEPEGYTRLFVDEGPPMMKLLREAARRGIRKEYCKRLLGNFPQEERSLAGAQDELVEALSDRELEVLRLLAEGCSNREIGERLYLSLSTVKGHTSNIYGKLLTRNRSEAVARARQLKILPLD